MLNELIIDGLRGVGRAELKFDPRRSVRTLFGSNGVGKTKCLEALYQFMLLSNRTFVEQVSYGLDPSFAVMRTAKDESSHVFQTPSLPKGHVILLKQVWGTGSPMRFHDLPVLFLGASNRSSLGDGTSSSELIGTFTERRQKYFNELYQALQHNRLSGLGMNSNVQAWFVSRAQSVNPYQKDTDNRRVEIDAVLEMLNVLDTRIDRSFLQIDGAGDVSVKVAGQIIPMRQLSSGFTSLVKLVQAIVSGYANFTNETDLRHVRGVVLIDEIESHLHAQWQSRIVPSLKTLLPNTTFYIATHSPLVLAQLEEGEAYVLQRSDNGVVHTELVSSPNKRAFSDVLADAFGVDLNKLKRESLEKDDQAEAKRALLSLLDSASGTPS